MSAVQQAVRYARRRLRWLKAIYYGRARRPLAAIGLARSLPGSSSPARALQWIRANESPGGGILVHSGHAEAYPEVTGYLIPTLLDYGERELARRLLRWLMSVQRPEGCVASPDGKPYIFDTGQVLRGLLAGIEMEPGAGDSARRAADYLCDQMVNGGAEGFGKRYDGEIPESIHLYVLPPLLEAARLFEVDRYRTGAQKCLDFYCRHPDALRLSDLTHFLSYQLEALIDLERAELAEPILETLRREQEPRGAVRAKDGVDWVCSPGQSQLAICWYKTGQWSAADGAQKWLEAHQNPSGGFRGNYRRKAAYFHEIEPSWAVKFYLDAHRLRVASFFDRSADLVPGEIPLEDGRVQAILAVVRPGDKVAEVGCGKGRILKALREVRSDTECTGVDISPVLLECVPREIHTALGSLESVPLADDSFDVVFCVEAIEHSANPEAAIGELIRIARPGGWVLVVDKQQAQWGRFQCPSWERWPEVMAMRESLARGCEAVESEAIAYEGRPASDGLFVAWRGRKRSPQGRTEEQT